MLDPTYRAPLPPPRREPVTNIPPAILLVLGVLIAIHIVRLIVPEAWDVQILLNLAFVPGRVTYGFDPARVATALIALSTQGEDGLRQAQVGRFFLGDGTFEPWTVLSYGLLHADWVHLGLNGVWLLAFGTPVARRLGPPRLLLFLAAATLAGALAHYLTHPVDLQPVIGASAAISGCMGAALRFMFQPRTPVAAIIGISDQARVEAFRQPLVALRDLFRDRRAIAFLIAWFLTNLLFGIGSKALGLTDGVVAWEAHIGGFLLGFLCFPVFDRARPRHGLTAPHEAPDPDLPDAPNPDLPEA